MNLAEIHAELSSAPELTPASIEEHLYGIDPDSHAERLDRHATDDREPAGQEWTADAVTWCGTCGRMAVRLVDEALTVQCHGCGER